MFTPGEDKYKFCRIMRRTDFSSYPSLDKIASNLYEATADVDLSQDGTGYDKVYKNYRIRVERPSAKEILEIKKLIDGQLKNKKHHNLLYHLDESQLQPSSDMGKYSKEKTTII